MGAAAVLVGLGAWVPGEGVDNDELACRLGLKLDGEWIRSRTGISRRHLVAPGESTGDLAIEACRRALASAGADVEPIDALVLATSTPDQLCPPTAPQVAAALGLGRIAAFDLGAVCSGFVYGLATGAGLLAAGIARTVLVVGADTFSTIVDPEDRTTAAIFGDGAGAVVLRTGRPGEPGAVGSFDLGSDGAEYELLTVPGGGSRRRSTGEAAKVEESYLVMDGPKLFARAVRLMAESLARSAALAGWALADVDRFVLHQANARILAAVARSLGVPEERFVGNIARVGNTAAASIPLALADAAALGGLRAGQRVLISGFGGGLTWGSAALVWPELGPVAAVAATPFRRITMHQVQSRIGGLLAHTLRVPGEAINADATFTSLGIDSLILVELALLLSDEFAVPIADGELLPEMTIGAVAELVLERSPAR
jgi:3-oxoacyl-[acyl-carrier-protein] synthase-3